MSAGGSVPGEEERRPYPDPEHRLAPRRPQTVGGAVYLAVLGTTVAGIVIVMVAEWRTGLTVIGAATVAGGLARLVIPDAHAGMLGIRRKLVDVLTMLVLGGALIVLAALIPEGPPPV